MSNDNAFDQSEIERLLGGAGGASSTPPPSSEPTSMPAAPPPSLPGALDQSELDALFGGIPAPAVPTAPVQPIGGMLDQSEIESLLGGVPSAPASGMAPTSSLGVIGGPFAEPEEDVGGVPRGDIDYIAKRADDSLRSVVGTKLDLPSEVIEFQFPEFGGAVPSNEYATLDQISEVELEVKIVLGGTDMYIEDILKLRKGSVVPLDKMAGDAVDIFINGRLLARGEVLVMNENFCVRVNELLAGAIPLE